jgi:hypothetical protein
LFVRATADDGGVDIDDRLVAAGAGAGGPRGRPGGGAGASQAPVLARTQPADGAPRGWLRRHGAEQRRLVAQHGQVRDALGAICERHDHLRQRHARVVAASRQPGHGLT